MVSNCQSLVQKASNYEDSFICECPTANMILLPCTGAETRDAPDLASCVKTDSKFEVVASTARLRATRGHTTIGRKYKPAVCSKFIQSYEKHVLS